MLMLRFLHVSRKWLKLATCLGSSLIGTTPARGYDPHCIDQPTTYDLHAAPFISLGEDFWAGLGDLNEMR